MRATELVGRRVVDADGHELGTVLGIRCVQDGPVRGVSAQLRVDALVVHRHALGAFLGYQLREQRGPHPVGALMRWIHRDARLVRWTDVEAVGDVVVARTSEPLGG